MNNDIQNNNRSCECVRKEIGKIKFTLSTPWVATRLDLYCGWACAGERGRAAPRDLLTCAPRRLLAWGACGNAYARRKLKRKKAAEKTSGRETLQFAHRLKKHKNVLASWLIGGNTHECSECNVPRCPPPSGEPMDGWPRRSVPRRVRALFSQHNISRKYGAHIIFAKYFAKIGCAPYFRNIIY